MSGLGGVQAKIKEIHPYAIYTHCMAHRLNLVVVDMCKGIKVQYAQFLVNTTYYNKFKLFLVCPKCIQYIRNAIFSFFTTIQLF